MATTFATKNTFRPATRLQESFLAAHEKRLLIWMAERTPAWINSDHLTALGFSAQLATGVSYAMAGFTWWKLSKWCLLAGIAFLILNWVGDSLDGTLARVRDKQRPRYGFYVDHMLDSVSVTVMMTGLALSGYMDSKIAIALLVLFLLLSIQSYLATHALGEFRMSFWSFGPTELRLLLIAGNLAVFHSPYVLHNRYRLFDIGGVIGIAGMTAMLSVFTTKNTVRLYREERID